MSPGINTAVGAEFGYARRLAPPVAVLLGLALIEAMVVHLLAMAWGGLPVALVLGFVDLGLVVALVSLLHSFSTRPVTLIDDLLVMRVGWKSSLPVPIDHISGFRSSWSASDLKASGVVNLALVAWPNTMVDLHTPIFRRGRQVHAIAHCLNEPAMFRARVEEAIKHNKAAGSA